MCLFDFTVLICNKEPFILFIGTINTLAIPPPLQTALYKPKSMRKNSIWWTIPASALCVQGSEITSMKNAWPTMCVMLNCCAGYVPLFDLQLRSQPLFHLPKKYTKTNHQTPLSSIPYNRMQQAHRGTHLRLFMHHVQLTSLMVLTLPCFFMFKITKKSESWALKRIVSAYGYNLFLS